MAFCKLCECLGRNVFLVNCDAIYDLGRLILIVRTVDHYNQTLIGEWRSAIKIFMGYRVNMGQIIYDTTFLFWGENTLCEEMAHLQIVMVRFYVMRCCHEFYVAHSYEC